MSSASSCLHWQGDQIMSEGTGLVQGDANARGHAREPEHSGSRRGARLPISPKRPGSSKASEEHPRKAPRRLSCAPHSLLRRGLHRGGTAPKVPIGSCACQQRAPCASSDRSRGRSADDTTSGSPDRGDRQRLPRPGPCDGARIEERRRPQSRTASRVRVDHVRSVPPRQHPASACRSAGRKPDRRLWMYSMSVPRT